MIFTCDFPSNKHQQQKNDCVWSWWVGTFSATLLGRTGFHMSLAHFWKSIFIKAPVLQEQSSFKSMLYQIDVHRCFWSVTVFDKFRYPRIVWVLNLTFLWPKPFYGYFQSQSQTLFILFNSSSPEQNDRHFSDDIFVCNFMNVRFCILIRIWLKFVPKGPIDNT